MKNIDIAHQINRLRSAKGMCASEALMIFRTLANNADTYEQVVEVSLKIF